MKLDRPVQAKKAAVIAAYKETCSVTKACLTADVHRRNHYDWLKFDPEYKAAFEASKDEACHALEDEAVRRAREGYDEPVFHKGEQCGVIRKYSDTLLIFLMKGAMPEKYADRQKVEHSANPDLLAAIERGKKRANGGA